MGREDGGKKIQGAPVLGGDFCWGVTTSLHAMSKMKLLAKIVNGVIYARVRIRV